MTGKVTKGQLAFIRPYANVKLLKNAVLAAKGQWDLNIIPLQTLPTRVLQVGVGGIATLVYYHTMLNEKIILEELRVKLPLSLLESYSPSELCLGSKVCVFKENEKELSIGSIQDIYFGDVIVKWGDEIVAIPCTSNALAPIYATNMLVDMNQFRPDDKQLKCLENSIRKNKSEKLNAFLDDFPDFVDMELPSHPSRCTPLMLAIECELWDSIIAILVTNGASFNKKDILGETSLHKAAKVSMGDLLAEILDQDVVLDPLITDNAGVNAFHLAIYHGNLNYAEFLSTVNPDVIEAKIEDGTFLGGKMGGKRPIHLAIEMNNIDCIRMLVRIGANVNSKGKHDLTPLQCVLDIQIFELSDLGFCKRVAAIMEILLNNGAQGFISPFQLLCSKLAEYCDEFVDDLLKNERELEKCYKILLENRMSPVEELVSLMFSPSIGPFFLPQLAFAAIIMFSEKAKNELIGDSQFFDTIANTLPGLRLRPIRRSLQNLYLAMFPPPPSISICSVHPHLWNEYNTKYGMEVAPGLERLADTTLEPCGHKDFCWYCVRRMGVVVCLHDGCGMAVTHYVRNDGTKADAVPVESIVVPPSPLPPLECPSLEGAVGGEERDEGINALIKMMSTDERITALQEALREQKGYKEKMLESLTCPVCMNKPSNMALAPCGHLICHGCYVRVLFCPNCRTRIGKGASIKIYNDVLEDVASSVNMPS